jgi:hypothetical protein
MESILIEGTAKTPSIKFEPASGKLEIKGRSIPEDSIGFYANLMISLDEFVNKVTVPAEVSVQLEYFNTASSKCIFEVLKRFEAIHVKGGKASVNWQFEEDDDDMRETGEDYKSLLTLPFNIQEIAPE